MKSYQARKFFSALHAVKITEELGVGKAYPILVQRLKDRAAKIIGKGC